ncbi:uncharacterized protein L969DRAFT_55141 [Mixia osmundae IAM 14324]|uniref:Uncharacterized protein n=1 Tax=Mixia osmundae (strain CBS 9802 / IAM 14324 / JCM 22182 / KY 12970) TaxID=764103 RepID=G7DUL8_MIXOS|nr:uncharacterized protein L969DRAFT_55141 [Mixia osmundae IAM 14324]KEI36388.1 hypothetical protein L969DRAFT_55141 [Mixia osmundae IAM 14324]GAA94278.1 hypothetical protein E5Q_00927 [Mixia osmundae IAM 14324]
MGLTQEKLGSLFASLWTRLATLSTDDRPAEILRASLELLSVYCVAKAVRGNQPALVATKLRLLVVYLSVTGHRALLATPDFTAAYMTVSRNLESQLVRGSPPASADSITTMTTPEGMRAFNEARRSSAGRWHSKTVEVPCLTCAQLMTITTPVVAVRDEEEHLPIYEPRLQQ